MDAKINQESLLKGYLYQEPNITKKRHHVNV